MDILKQYKAVAFIVVAVLAFIFISFLPVVDVMGKGTMSGFKYTFDATGAGFSRFMMFLCIAAPVVAGVFAVLANKKGVAMGALQLVVFGAGVLLGLLTLAMLPSGCGFAAGGWLYVVFCALGAGLGAIVANDEK